MGKRGNGEGSIYRRKDGRWVGQYLVHTAKVPKYRYIYGKTRQAVAEKLTKAMADRDGGPLASSTRRCMSPRPYRLEDRAVPLPWPE